MERDPHFASGDHATLSTLWCHRLIGRPENRLTGVSFAYGGYHGFFSGTPQTGAYTVHRPGHWLFAGTGLEQGDLLGEKDQIVSYECDGCEFELVGGLPVPTCRDGTPDTFEILATAPASLSDGDDSIAMASEAIYGPGAGRRLTEGAAVLGAFSRGGTVVTTGCTDWCMGLKGGDPAVVDDPSLLPAATRRAEVRAPASGWVSACHALTVGVAAARLGAGRERKEDSIDPGVGITILAKPGDRVEKGQTLAEAAYREESRWDAVRDFLAGAWSIDGQPPDTVPLIGERIRSSDMD